MPEASPVLAADEVHLWRVPLDVPEAVVTRAYGLLSSDERARAERFRIPGHRARFIIGRATVRGLLGRYLDLDPAGISFRIEAYGKPVVASGDPRLQFNLAHSHDLALMAVGRCGELGIDVERIRPMVDAEPIVDRYFAPGERAEFAGLPEHERRDAFFRCWTRKEAYMKATGLGFSLPLEQFEVTLGPGEPARLVSVQGRPDEVARWMFHDIDPGPGFAAALATERGDWRFRFFQFVHS